MSSPSPLSARLVDRAKEGNPDPIVFPSVTGEPASQGEWECFLGLAANALTELVIVCEVPANPRPWRTCWAWKALDARLLSKTGALGQNILADARSGQIWRHWLYGALLSLPHKNRRR